MLAQHDIETVGFHKVRGGKDERRHYGCNKKKNDSNQAVTNAIVIVLCYARCAIKLYELRIANARTALTEGKS
jgi:hypothetical protein